MHNLVESVSNRRTIPGFMTVVFATMGASTFLAGPNFIDSNNVYYGHGNSSSEWQLNGDICGSGLMRSRGFMGAYFTGKDLEMSVLSYKLVKRGIAVRKVTQVSKFTKLGETVGHEATT